MSEKSIHPALALNIISQIRQLAQNYLKDELDRAGLTGLVPSHGSILGSLYVCGPLPMQRIAEKIGRRKSTLTVLADKLEQEGYIQRDVSPEDSRVRQVSLTAKGEASRGAFLAINERLQQTLWQGFTVEEQERLMSDLARLAANFQAAAASPSAAVPILSEDEDDASPGEA